MPITDMGDGDVYEGEHDEEDQPSGKGVMVFEDGSVLQGWWKDGVPDGKCRNILANGIVKEGIFENWEYIGPIVTNDY